jgi:glycosyltransferase involved in cell wall biosynthesis
MLNAKGVSSEIDLVPDANYIDSSVMAKNPAVIFIEGLWVTPEKFVELMALPHHAGRTWVVRYHSEIPFLASEGVAMSWTAQYLAAGVIIAPNAPRADDQLRRYARELGYTEAQIAAKIKYLPNSYPTDFRPLSNLELDTSAKTVLDVACFGAYRPLKNHLQQALGAADLARSLGKTLRFHVNDRQDAGGSGPFSNVKGMFDSLDLGSYELVLHGWEDRATFLTSLQGIDILFQNSISETFNIVAADAVWVGRPVLASSEIPWIYPITANPVNHVQSLQVAKQIWSNKSFFINQNRSRLRGYVAKSDSRWVTYVGAFQA